MSLERLERHATFIRIGLEMGFSLAGLLWVAAELEQRASNGDNDVL